jgi:hypothetical protein
MYIFIALLIGLLLGFIIGARYIDKIYGDTLIGILEHIDRKLEVIDCMVETVSDTITKRDTES